MFNFFKKNKTKKFKGISEGSKLLTSFGTHQSGSLSLIDKRLGFHELRHSGRIIAYNNEHGTHFCRYATIKVNGENGVLMDSRVFDLKTKEFKTELNSKIEKAWKKWGRAKNADFSQQINFRQIRNLLLMSVIRDGEAFIIAHRGADCEFRFSIQIIESDMLDYKLNTDLSNGNYIRNGIEFDYRGRRVAYYFIKDYQEGEFNYGIHSSDYLRVSSENVKHVFIRKSISQKRGETWFAPVIEKIRAVCDYQNAELVSSVHEASKMGFLIKKGVGKYQGDDVDDKGNPIISSEPGTMTILDEDYDLKSYDPQHPTGSFDKFVKTILRGVGIGLGISYNSLSGDLENVNYSSLRSGYLEEKDLWRFIQRWTIDEIEDFIFPIWIEMAVLSGQLDLGWNEVEEIQDNYEDFIKWRCRGYANVDPVKETASNIDGIKMGIKTRGDVLSDSGQSFDEVIQKLRYEQEALKSAGLSFEDIEKQKVSDDE